MRLPETRDLFARKLSFPVSCQAVIDTLGEERLEAPTGESETVGEVMERCTHDEFESADELYDALLTFVSDAYIGRKFYDDRGGQQSDEGEGVSL